jgi:antitoxin HicB
VFDNDSVKGAEFLRRVKHLAGRNQLDYRWNPERGVGSHGTLYLGSRFTVVKDLKKELGPGLLSDMCKTARHSQGGPLVFTATYPATILREQQDQGLHVRFRDLPEALTGGDDLQDTLAQAADCLAEAIAGRIARGDAIPRPSKPRRADHLVSVPLALAPKLALYLAMREQGLRKTQLAERLGISETVVRRMLDPKHRTKPDRIQAALAALGKRIVVTFEDAA